ncbi:hypothetical protein BJ138DRAFT_1107924 [Hygrophoropsis aurantiaca]|uniref:Uncharacterized protein n=1 Tax=Hygrophoropsis aurantiaca TaxID=72124 RepID=A0ACB7ZR15_9AGAM|nr:hypothetical protein BJ138DRAFT_1107924 [Hygrophoropsis aurantiaca]
MLLLVIAISLFQWFQIAFTQDNGTVGACIAATGYGWRLWPLPKRNIPLVRPFLEWPANIASDTEIPKWAYMALVNGFWDGPQAQANASAVATQVTTQTSSQSATASQHTATTTNAPTPSPSTSPPPSTDSKSPNNTGAIAGGVVGGVVAGAIISFLGIFFWRRRSLKPTYEPTPQTETWELPRSPPAMVSAVPNPRNPNDPSTFPPSSGVPSNSTWTASGVYTGAPEL